MEHIRPVQKNTAFAIFSIKWRREGWDDLWPVWKYRIVTDQHDACQYPYPYRDSNYVRGDDEDWWMWHTPQEEDSYYFDHRDVLFAKMEPLPPCLFFVNEWRVEVRIEPPAGQEDAMGEAATVWCPAPAPGKRVECSTR